MVDDGPRYLAVIPEEHPFRSVSVVQGPVEDHNAPRTWKNFYELDMQVRITFKGEVPVIFYRLQIGRAHV